MKGRPIAALFLLLMAVAVVIVRRSSLPSAESPPIPLSTSRLPALSEPERPAKPGPEATPGSSESKAGSSWLRVTMDVPDPKSFFSFEARVFDLSDGVEQEVHHANVDHFDVGPLRSGRKGFLLFSGQGDFCPFVTFVTIPESRDANLVLRPQRSVLLEGVVVDASGQGVFAIDLEFNFVVPLGGPLPPNGFQGNLFSGVAGRGGGSGQRRGYRGSSSWYSVSLEGDRLELTESVSTDSDGHFQLRLYTGPSVALLRFKRGETLIKEESVLPSLSPLRLVVPVLPEPPKK